VELYWKGLRYNIAEMDLSANLKRAWRSLLNINGCRKIANIGRQTIVAGPKGHDRYLEKPPSGLLIKKKVTADHVEAQEHSTPEPPLPPPSHAEIHLRSALRCGFGVAAGIILGVDGVVRSLLVQHIHRPDSPVGAQARYLLQIYAGYFLAVLLLLSFAINCKIWTMTGIDYRVLFGDDARPMMELPSITELSCLLFFLNGLFLWLNFRKVGPEVMSVHWPILLGGCSLLIFCVPLPIFHQQTRKCWAVSHLRLLLIGLRPIDFRDSYLADMYCSAVYSISQLEIFFFLYAHHWEDPPRCNFNHSRVLAICTTIPATWRTLQCLRSFYDSRDWFPHIANVTKYVGTIAYYVSLGLYRLHSSHHTRAVFITFSVLNGVYCSIWDVAVDFGLGNPYARYQFLRHRLIYRRVWVYYIVMVLNVGLRQQWIFYAIFQYNVQHDSALNFFIGLAEVFRRGMWSFFRIENEYCQYLDEVEASQEGLAHR
jgi:xenotropic and polytropic retrovirus receptor 1